MLPWPDMWRAARHAGLAPEAFWRLSLKEWRWLCAAGGDPLDRARLAELMEMCPDDGLRRRTDSGGCRTE